MGTRSRIGKLNDDGTVTSIYCHWDGYPSWTGRILLEHWNDHQRVDQLLSLGDLSGLGETGDAEAYRTRGEPGVDAITHTADGWPDSGSEWQYLWIPSLGGWQVLEVGGPGQWRSLKGYPFDWE